MDTAIKVGKTWYLVRYTYNGKEHEKKLETFAGAKLFCEDLKLVDPKYDVNNSDGLASLWTVQSKWYKSIIDGCVNESVYEMRTYIY